MTSSASGASDIRVGDLVKATLSSDTESTWTARVTRVTPRYVDSEYFGASIGKWDFEILDRPLPPIDEELLSGAVKVYKAEGQRQYPGKYPLSETYYENNIAAVIRFVNEYHNKKGTNA